MEHRLRPLKTGITLSLGGFLLAVVAAAVAGVGWIDSMWSEPFEDSGFAVIAWGLGVVALSLGTIGAACVSAGFKQKIHSVFGLSIALHGLATVVLIGCGNWLFDWYSLPATPGAIALGTVAGLWYLGHLAFIVVLQTVLKTLTDAMIHGTGNLAGLAELPGVTILGGADNPNREGLVCFALDHVPAADIVAKLNAQGIRTHIRKADHYSGNILTPLGLGSAVRVSMCHYNTVDEVSALLAAMKGIVEGA